LANDFAISQSFLEDALSDVDRVTIYRTLNSFEEKGIVHRIQGADNEVKYAFCSSHCHEGKHDDNHVHFTCNECDKTYCIEQELPTVNLPEGYHMTKISVLSEGTCKNCQ